MQQTKPIRSADEIMSTIYFVLFRFVSLGRLCVCACVGDLFVVAYLF